MPESSDLISVNPATLEELGRTPVTTPQQVEQTVNTARAEFTAWRSERGRRQGMLAACSYELARKTPELVPLLVREQGKTRAEAAAEVWISARCLAHMAGQEWDDSSQAPDAPGRAARIEHRPMGVVAAIVPWNFPVYLAIAKIAPALAAGNTVVVKPAESVSLVVGRMVRILRSLLPEGVLDVVYGGPATAQALIAHPSVRKVSFTGSTQVGTQIMRQAAESITPVTLELGGNDPAIVLDDAEIPSAAASLAHSAFFGAGQMCIAPKRAYVPTHFVDDFCAAFASAMQGVAVGDGLSPATGMGPLHNRAQLEFVRELLDDALESGATIVQGGGNGSDLPGHFLEPTLVRDVDDTTPLVAQEQFGPVFPVVAYDDLDAVLERLGTEPFGLGASVWGEAERATQIADRIDAGTVWVNQHNALEVGLPFGGIKASGFGREGGTAGIEDFLETRVVNIRARLSA